MDWSTERPNANGWWRYRPVVDDGQSHPVKVLETVEGGYPPELRGEARVAVADDESTALEEPIDGVGQVAGDLRQPASSASST